MDIKLFDTPPFLSFNLSITRILFHYFRTTNINHRLRYREILMLTFYEMSILQVGTEHFLFGDISVDNFIRRHPNAPNQRNEFPHAPSPNVSPYVTLARLHFLI